MLYPIQYELGSEKFNTVDVPVSTGNLRNKGGEVLYDSNSEGSYETNLPIYQSPQTHNCTKLLMQANIIMNDHYDICSDFVPLVTRPKWLNLYHKL